MSILTTALLWFTALSVAIMAGVYFTFSSFVMRALTVIDAPAGMLAMQSINRIILKSAFLPAFFGSSVASVALVVWGLINFREIGAPWVAAGGATYFLGMFVVTVFGNVPLNNRLEETPAQGPESSIIWALYLRRWTAWNHIRMIACVVSLVLLILAISARL